MCLFFLLGGDLPVDFRLASPFLLSLPLSKPFCFSNLLFQFCSLLSFQQLNHNLPAGQVRWQNETTWQFNKAEHVDNFLPAQARLPHLDPETSLNLSSFIGDSLFLRLENFADEVGCQASLIFGIEQEIQASNDIHDSRGRDFFPTSAQIELTFPGQPVQQFPSKPGGFCIEKSREGLQQFFDFLNLFGFRDAATPLSGF